MVIGPDESGPAAAPTDPLRAIFGSEALSGLKGHAYPSQALTHRINVIESDTLSSPDPLEEEHLCWRRAQRIAWSGYLDAAFKCGLFQGASGNDLRARLTGLDDDNFRSAMAECMACWFLSARLNLSVVPRPLGQGAHQLELMVETPRGDVSVEVKAPCREAPNDVWAGDDADMLARSVRDANKQFEKGRMNLLFIAPRLRTSVYGCRHQLVRAFLGEHKFTMLLNARTGERVRDLELEFFPEGQFLQNRLPSGKKIKPDGSPPFTRVSAVLCVEEDLIGDGIGPGPLRIEHHVLLLHNPRAQDPIPPNLLGDCVHLDYEAGKWTDGRGLYP